MTHLGLETTIVDQRAFDHSLERFRAEGIVLPTFAQLADPSTVPAAVDRTLAAVGPDDAHSANLFRVHWFNGGDRVSRAVAPEHVVLPSNITGVDAQIVLALGNRFPMIRAHKVLAAYACLAPRVVTGQFDPVTQRAVWPSTGNYARGGVAISRIMGCRGVAVLPEHMSRERFEWLDRWVADPADVIRTPGSESNVKEIYDACHRLERDPANVILNQFCEFGNHLGHYTVTGRALATLFDSLQSGEPTSRLAAFVSASGSAGTLGAGDYLKDHYGARIVAVEALECPTLLYNGYGEHNIQGIGDKHVPLIHNVTNTDLVVGVSDRSTDALDVLFNTPEGRRELERRGVDGAVIERLPDLGLSSIANLIAAIKTAKRLRLGADDVVVTVATDGSEMYGSERAKTIGRDFPDGFDGRAAAAVFAEHLAAAHDDHVLECTTIDRDRIFNLGYFTWVEQQGISLADFDARRSHSFWRELRSLVPVWDEMITDFNARTGAASR